MQAPTSNYGCGADDCVACYGDEEWRATQMPRECRFTHLGHEDGIDWYQCETHDHETIGDDFPCEGWLDENRAKV